MAAPSDPRNQQEAAMPMRKQNKGPPFMLLVPLVYAPVLPLILLTLQHRPVLRDRLFVGVLAGAFAHAFYLAVLHYWLKNNLRLIFAFYVLRVRKLRNLILRTVLPIWIWGSFDLSWSTYYEVLKTLRIYRVEFLDETETHVN